MIHQLITISTLFVATINAIFIQNQPRNGVVTLDFELASVPGLDKRQIAELDSFTDLYFKSIVEVGSNRDPVLLFLDTGSWLTQIPDVSTNCTKCLLPNGKPGLFNSNKSTTAVRTGNPARSTFYKGAAYFYGEYVLDDVWFASNFKIPKVLFNDVSEIGPTWPFGILGLISKPITSISATNSSATNLQLYLGGYSESHLDGDFDWYPIQGTQVSALVNSININGTNIPVNVTPLFDYGNPALYFKQEVYDAITNSFPFDPNNRRGSRQHDASLFKDKSFTLTIHGKNYTIPLVAFIKPGCTGKHCPSVMWSQTYTSIGSPILRFLNLAVNVDIGNEFIGLANWKSSDTNNVVSF
ncbi:hypothetical protein KGF54_003538 [Candida jiufengensis]|uniref:uncharacterized protein n=1 Tax=Candida jiufengensis TaxID=497108 RepID=UPI002224E824|nr:uncharacterized protein KGF54_003538 [Candida jiufengensis]KAI5952671.1 hypothetical protein KGF54_003538 [Candida jiufengensis]